jgi:hypothetical protein
MTMQWEDKKVMSEGGDHDDKMIPTSIWGQDITSSKVFIDYNSQMEYVDLVMLGW